MKDVNLKALLVGSRVVLPPMHISKCQAKRWALIIRKVLFDLLLPTWAPLWLEPQDKRLALKLFGDA